MRNLTQVYLTGPTHSLTCWDLTDVALADDDIHQDDCIVHWLFMMRQFLSWTYRQVDSRNWICNILLVRHLMASSRLEIWSASTYQAKGEGFKHFFFIAYYHIIWFLYFFTFVFSCQVVKSYLTLSEEKRIKTFKNCHSFQNCEIFTCPENWNSLCCRFFVLVKNFSRLPKSRLAILVRELYIAQCLPEKWTSLHLLAPIGALYAIVHCTRTGPQAIHFYNF